MTTTASKVRNIRVDGTLIGYVDIDTMTFVPVNEIETETVVVEPVNE
jgi:hypothetical protein